VFTYPLPSNGCLIVGARWLARECVYRVVAQHWVYTSQYEASGRSDNDASNTPLG
jgi:hypothetical protein